MFPRKTIGVHYNAGLLIYKWKTDKTKYGPLNWKKETSCFDEWVNDTI